MTRLSTVTMMDQVGNQVKKTAIPNDLPLEANTIMDTDIDESMVEQSETHDADVIMNPPLGSVYHQQTDTEYHEQIDNGILVDNTEMEESAQECLTELPVPPTAKPLRQGR